MAAGQSPLAQFEIKRIVPIEIGNMDVSFTNSSVFMVLTVIAVSLDRGDTSKVVKFVDEHSLTFPVLLDLDGIAERIYPSFTIPFTYVIDKKGRIAARVDGAKNWSSNETFAALDILIKK